MPKHAFIFCFAVGLSLTDKAFCLPIYSIAIVQIVFPEMVFENAIRSNHCIGVRREITNVCIPVFCQAVDWNISRSRTIYSWCRVKEKAKYLFQLLIVCFKRQYLILKNIIYCHDFSPINDNLDATVQAIYQEFFVNNPDKGSWKQGVVGDVLQLQRGHDLPRAQMLGGEYPVAGSTGTIGYHNQFTATSPVIVMGRSGNIGNPRLYLCNCWTHNTSLYVKQLFNSEAIWAFYLLKSLNYDGFVGGSAVPTLNRNDVHAYGITIPPLDLQRIFSQKALRLIVEKENNLAEIKKLEDLQGTVLATISSH